MLLCMFIMICECASDCLLSKWVREEKVKFWGGWWFSLVSLNRPASLHPESALSHLLTLSAHCHSNGVQESESLGKAKYSRRNTSLTSLCFNRHWGYARNVHCALAWMYTYFTNPIKTQFISVKIHYSGVFVCFWLSVSLSGKGEDEQGHQLTNYQIYKSWSLIDITFCHKFKLKVDCPKALISKIWEGYS